MKLSIITINLNNHVGLYNTIESVLSQKSADYLEFIVIDGQSNDGSVELISSYGSKIDKTIVEKDSGIYNAMNKGVKIAEGEYLLFLNSADVLYNNDTISCLLPFLSDADLVIGKTEYNDLTQNRIFLTEHSRNGCDLNYLIKASLPHQSTFIKREILLNGYDEKIKIGGDWKFFLEAVCINKCSVKILDQVITKFDLNGISSNPANYAAIDDEKARVLWELFRYDFYEWRKLDDRVKTADYYEQLFVMKVYFKLNWLLRQLKKISPFRISLRI